MHGRRAVSVMPRSSAYESSQDNYAMDDSINRAEYFSNAVLEDTYNQALSSRGRDDDLLRSANATIAYNTEHRPLAPRSSIVTRRMRASSVPPRQVRAPRRSVQAPRRVHYSYPKEGVYYSPTIDTQGLTASRPPIRVQATVIPTNRRVIRQVETYVKPKPNLLSWEHRLESRMNPSDIIYEPASYERIRKQVRDVKDKMDLTKQLHDRYLEPSHMTSSTRRHLANGGAASGGAVGTLPKYYACGGDPMHPPVSELRRKLRRTICQSKGIPNYYRLKDMKDE